MARRWLPPQQDRLKAVHHADVGWKPSSMEQRNGRILRQGNGYDEVEIYRYITEETFDSYSWQILEQKHLKMRNKIR